MRERGRDGGREVGEGERERGRELSVRTEAFVKRQVCVCERGGDTEREREREHSVRSRKSV